MTEKNRIQWSLFLLRIGVFIVMFVWTLDKFINPEHAATVYKHFYFMDVELSIMTIIGVVEMAIILAFVAGLYKRFTYGFVVIVHGVSTLSSWKQYTVDINLLFFAAWPMLAACIALYLLRDMDNKWTLSKAK